jgi:hypothetical protein
VETLAGLEAVDAPARFAVRLGLVRCALSFWSVSWFDLGAVSSFSNRGPECKRFVIFPLDSILLFDRAAGILPPRPQTCLATARSGGQ